MLWDHCKQNMGLLVDYGVPVCDMSRERRLLMLLSIMI